MPLDFTQTYDPFYDRCSADLKFAWLPKRCAISKKQIWFKYAYKLTVMYTGPGDPVYEYRWHNKNEHLLWELKGRK